MNKTNHHKTIQSNHVENLAGDTKQSLEAWETPQLVRLDIDLTANNFGVGADGDPSPAYSAS